MPRQTSIQLTEKTERQVGALKAQGFGTFTSIVRIAIDRMHREETKMAESVMVRDLGDSGSIHAAQGRNGKWYLGRFNLQTGQISNGRWFARGQSANAVLEAGYDRPYSSLDDARIAAQEM